MIVLNHKQKREDRQRLQVWVSEEARWRISMTALAYKQSWGDVVDNLALQFLPARAESYRAEQERKGKK